MFDPFTLAYAIFGVGVSHLVRGEAQAAHEQSEAMIALSNEHGFADFLGLGTHLRGWALSEQGQHENGISDMGLVVDAFRGTELKLGVTWFLIGLAEAYGKAERPEEGLTVVGEAFALMKETGERIQESRLYRMKGDLLLGISKPDQAESCFRQALDIARAQSAKSFELQATMSLARLWQKQGKKAEARQLLAEIYAWFTEGFDTRDLKEAKALLEELA
jgi:adenylate cyclase